MEWGLVSGLEGRGIKLGLGARAGLGVSRESGSDASASRAVDLGAMLGLAGKDKDRRSIRVRRRVQARSLRRLQICVLDSDPHTGTRLRRRSLPAGIILSEGETPTPQVERVTSAAVSHSRLSHLVHRFTSSNSKPAGPIYSSRPKADSRVLMSLSAGETS